jgi:predicted kinase
MMPDGASDRRKAPHARPPDFTGAQPVVMFLNGSIGAGKTTLGRALAARIGAAFIDSDDLQDHAERWVDQVLTVSERLVCAAMDALSHHPVVIVARPLRARDWMYFRARFAVRGIATCCISLTASEAAIMAPSRGRIFDRDERARIRRMIAEGYGARRFSDRIVHTDQRSFSETVVELAVHCRALVQPLIAREAS